MPLDQVQLDPYFLAKIYAQPIIPGSAVTVEPVQNSLPKVKFLGENQKNIGVFIQNGNEAYLNEELFNLLTNILNACKLGMQDIALINTVQYGNQPISVWQEALPLKQAIFFGITASSLGLEDVPVYQVVAAAKGTTLLFSDPLEMIGQDKQLKGRLWNALKQLLGI
ncbi:hypothetical protein KTO58_18735 [Chitinophaga pendula]|uniref:hypothetical protein n=1 Tax=Chitinophaga TaxID=79328 RepID=UPI0012FE26BE|nr:MULTISPECIES: hypothetical protein [Chitinophaga]UCJ05712.1 hypothetical protein KTO58_18735 [Chitinophaga pendula]